MPSRAGFYEILRHVRGIARLRPREWVALLQETFNEWTADKAPRLGAALAFYTLLSLAPLLVVIVAVAAVVYGRTAAQGQLVWQIQNLVGPEVAKTIQGVIQSAYKPAAGTLATILGLLTLAFGASTVVVELRDALNCIWKVPAKASETTFGSTVRMVRERAYSFAMVLGVGFLLIVSLVLNAWVAAMGTFFASLLPTPEIVLQGVTFLVSFLVITFLFAAIYKVLPDIRLEWSNVMIGAAATSLFFGIGKQLIGLYLGKASFSSTYGAAGSLVLVLVWVYYSAQIFFLGAEFTKVYTRNFGTHFAKRLNLGGPTSGIIIDPKNPRERTISWRD